MPAGTDSDSVKEFRMKKQKFIKEGLNLETMNKEFIDEFSKNDPSKILLEKELGNDENQSKNIV